MSFVGVGYPEKPSGLPKVTENGSSRLDMRSGGLRGCLLCLQEAVDGPQGWQPLLIAKSFSQAPKSRVLAQFPLSSAGVGWRPLGTEDIRFPVLGAPLPPGPQTAVTF